jgi:hypothetical protein
MCNVGDLLSVIFLHLKWTLCVDTHLMTTYNTPRYIIPLGCSFSTGMIATDGSTTCYTPVPPCTDNDPVSAGYTRDECVDTVITQGPGGVTELDRILRECLQYEPGSLLYMGVSYAMLRMQVRQSNVTSVFRIFMPEQVVLYVGPVGGAVDSVVLMHVRVFRLFTLPREVGVNGHNGKRKAKDTRVEYMSDDATTEHTGRVNSRQHGNHTSEKVSSTFHDSNTLRHRR